MLLVFMMLPVVLEMMLNGKVVVMDVKNTVRSCAVQHGADLNQSAVDPNTSGVDPTKSAIPNQCESGVDTN